MGLHSLSISSLGKNLQKLIIRQEEETWEGTSLCLEIVFKALLNLIKISIVLLESSEKCITIAHLSNKRHLLGSQHVVFPELINALELFCFVGQLLLDILSIENVLQVHPGLLEHQPLVNDVGYVSELLLPDLNLVSDFSDVLGPHRSLNSHLMVLQLSDKIINLSDKEPVLGISVPPTNEVRLIPKGSDLADGLQDTGFSSSKRRDLLNSVEVLIDALLQQLVESEVEQG